MKSKNKSVLVPKPFHKRPKLITKISSSIATLSVHSSPGTFTPEQLLSPECEMTVKVADSGHSVLTLEIPKTQARSDKFKRLLFKYRELANKRELMEQFYESKIQSLLEELERTEHFATKETKQVQTEEVDIDSKIESIFKGIRQMKSSLFRN